MARQTKFSSPYFLASVIAITTAFFSFPGFIGDFMSVRIDFLEKEKEMEDRSIFFFYFFSS